MSIAVVVPTIRRESYMIFREKWKELFKRHGCVLLTVWDGKQPILNVKDHGYTVEDVMGKDVDLIYNLNDGVRNLGFAFIAKNMPEVDTIMTLDDDTEPVRDTIQDHLKALEQNVSTGWISTTTEYTRGFPYNVRHEAEVVLSHGVWEGIKDWDAPTQLVRGNPDVSFYKGPIPKGVFYPMCGMNIAFKRKLLPYMYFAPMGHKVGLDRFGDIWCGIESKKVIDQKGWAVVSGYANVFHSRASNVFENLSKEAKGIQMNENYGTGDYFAFYSQKRNQWKSFIQKADKTLV